MQGATDQDKVHAAKKLHHHPAAISASPKLDRSTCTAAR
jgi:hypothetical protein